MIRYRGKISDKFQNLLNKVNYFRPEKANSVLPSLRPSVDKSMESRIVYKIKCLQMALVTVHMKSCGHSTPFEWMMSAKSILNVVIKLFNDL